MTVGEFRGSKVQDVKKVIQKLLIERVTVNYQMVHRCTVCMYGLLSYLVTVFK